MSLLDTLTNQADSVWHVVSAFADKHQEGIQALCIVAGLVVAFCGRVILRPVVFLLGFLPSTAVFWLVGHSLVNDANPDNLTTVEKLAAAGAVLLGLLVGLVLLKALFRVAVAIICGGMGAVLVLALSLFLPHMVGKNAELVLELFIVCGVTVCVGLSLYVRETMAIFGTAFDGSAMATYALAGFLGKRPVFFPGEAADAPTPVPHAWKAFYGTFVLTLGTFCALMQLRLARAEDRAGLARKAAASTPVQGSVDYTPIPDPEVSASAPPSTPGGGELEQKAPLYANDEESGYGATEHGYSVPLNMGAPPLNAPILDPVDGRGKPEY